MSKSVKYNLDEMKIVKDNYQDQLDLLKSEYETIEGHIDYIATNQCSESITTFCNAVKNKNTDNDNFIKENQEAIDLIEEKNTLTENTINEINTTALVTLDVINQAIVTAYDAEDYSFLKDLYVECYSYLVSLKNKLTELLVILKNSSSDDGIDRLHQEYSSMIGLIDQFITKYFS